MRYAPLYRRRALVGRARDRVARRGTLVPGGRSICGRVHVAARRAHRAPGMLQHMVVRRDLSRPPCRDRLGGTRHLCPHRLALGGAVSHLEERQQKQQTPFSIFTSSHSAVNVAIEVLKRIDATPTRILTITSYRGFPKKVYTTIGRLVARCAKQKCGPSGQLWAFPTLYVSIPAALERQPPASPTWSAVQSTGEPSAGSRQTHSSLYPRSTTTVSGALWPAVHGGRCKTDGVQSSAPRGRREC